MKSILPIFTVVAALAATVAHGQGVGNVAGADTRPNGGTLDSALPAAASSSPPAVAATENLVNNVLAAIDTHTSVAGKIKQKVNLFGHQLIGSGTYLQEGRGAERKLRLELKLEVDDQTSSLQHVCDGTYLWMHQDLLGKTALSRVDVRRLRTASPRQDNLLPLASPSSAMWVSLGGVPKLLESLADAFRFTSVKPIEVDRLAMWAIEGEWKPEKLAQMLPNQKNKILAGQPADLNKLGEHVPRRVVLVVGQDDLFPYRIEYWGSHPRSKKSAPSEQLIVEMDLFEIQFDAPIDPHQFLYNPGDSPFEDQTADYLQKLGFEGRTEAAGVRTPTRQLR
jgi:hypothetical protein